MHISGPEQGKLAKAIQSAFPNQLRLGAVLRSQLDDDIQNYAVNWGTYPDTINELLSAYNSKYKIGALVAALLHENETNQKLLEFAWRHQLIKRSGGTSGPTDLNDNSLERMLEPDRGFTDVGQLLLRIGQVVNSVCQVSYPVADGIVYGTGLLIGSGTVLTNWHVVERVTADNRRSVRLKFDYMTSADGTMVAPGVDYHLVDHDTEWLLDHSPYDSADLFVRTIEEEQQLNRDPEKLDYAVLRVAGSPGNKPVGLKASENAPPRGFLPLSDGIGIPPDARSAIWCFQHPYYDGQSQPQQVDWDQQGVIGVNPNRTRVWYTVNTLRGSSGAPVLSGRLRLCALHHAGGKDWPDPGKYLYNRGIPIVTIRNLLEKRGKLQQIT